MFLRPTALLVLALVASFAQAEVRLPKLLSSHMVLQRDLAVHIWGWADPGEKVTVTLETASQAATADRLGHWGVFLPPQPAGGPFQLTITGSNKIVLDDVLSGDVWFASGQSNMEMPLKGFPGNAVLKNSEAEIRGANQPNIRLLFVPHNASDYPLDDVDQSWTMCTPETATNFSAVAYFFGRDLVEKEHVPIGLIDSTWGGTPGEAWVSLDGLSSDASLMGAFRSWADMTKTQADVPAMRKAEKSDDAAARAANRPPPNHAWHPDPRSWAPAGLYNGMVAPAVQFPIKGVIWYQGESNSVADRAPLYEKVFSALISDWRMHWHEGNFPFLFVQISSFRSTPAEIWPIIREAQRRTLALADTAMAVTIDVGDPGNVHPADKQTVGARLALGARAVAYHEKVEYSGPMFRQATINNGTVRLWFDHASGGLVARGGDLQGFEVAGADHHFSNATARIDGDSVLVMAPEGVTAKYVRYGWANAPTVNLFDSAGLPASPFTSEDRIPGS